jgi:hypothetical protein
MADGGKELSELLERLKRMKIGVESVKEAAEAETPAGRKREPVLEKTGEREFEKPAKEEPPEKYAPTQEDKEAEETVEEVVSKKAEEKEKTEEVVSKKPKRAEKRGKAVEEVVSKKPKEAPKQGGFFKKIGELEGDILDKEHLINEDLKKLDYLLKALEQAESELGKRELSVRRKDQKLSEELRQIKEAKEQLRKIIGS